MQRLGKMLSVLLFIAVLGALVFSLSANFLIIIQGTFSPLRVVEGASMTPTLRSNDAVLVLAAEPDTLRVGDVVVFPDPVEEGANVVHRIVDFVDIDGQLYAVTRGDANPDVDPFLVPVDGITGRVVMNFPRGGAFLSFLQSPEGYLICVIWPLAVVFLYFLSLRCLEKDRGKMGIWAYELLPGE